MSIATFLFVEFKLWQGNSMLQIEYFQMTRFFSLYTKQSTLLKNKLHGEDVLTRIKSIPDIALSVIIDHYRYTPNNNIKLKTINLNIMNSIWFFK